MYCIQLTELSQESMERAAAIKHERVLNFRTYRYHGASAGAQLAAILGKSCFIIKLQLNSVALNRVQ